MTHCWLQGSSCNNVFSRWYNKKVGHHVRDFMEDIEQDKQDIDQSLNDVDDDMEEDEHVEDMTWIDTCRS